MRKASIFLFTAIFFAFLFSELAEAQITPGGACNASVQPYGCANNGLYYCPNATWILYDNCTSYSPMRYCDFSLSSGSCSATPKIIPGSYCTSGNNCWNNEYLTCSGSQWTETENCTSSGKFCSSSGCVSQGQNFPGSYCNATVQPFMCYRNDLYYCPSNSWVLNQNCTSQGRYCSYSQSAGSCAASPQNIPGSWCSGSPTNMCFQNRLYSCQSSYWGLQEDCVGEGKYCGLGACYNTPQYTPGSSCNATVTPFTCITNDLYYCPSGLWILMEACSSEGKYCVASNTSGTCAPTNVTTTTVPPVNVTPTPIEPIPAINQTEWHEAGYDWALPFFTPLFIVSFVIAVVAGVIARIGGMTMGGVSALLMVLVMTLFGIYPLWVGIVFLIIAGFIITKLVVEAVGK